MRFLQQLVFGPFRLDLAGEQLWHGDQQVVLRPQVFAVLRYLVEHPNHLITQEALLREVWQGRYVSGSTIRGCIREIRTALHDATDNPRYIETVGRKGYRFVGSRDNSPGTASADAEQRLIVGRHGEIDQLGRYLARAATGERQLILVSGEAGLGKTSLADLFIQEVGKDHQVLVGRGRCVDQYGQNEAYLPIVDLLYDLGRSADRDAVLSILRRHAPSWLAQLTMFLDESERECLQRQLPGNTQTGMLQELNHAFIALAEARPLLLLIEDLHWCDTSTLELLAYLAQCREPARWLILGTYRPIEVGMRKHRLHDLLIELQARECCRQLALTPLTAEDTAAYLYSRLEGAVAGETVRRLHHRTGGNPLFLKNIVDHLLKQELLRQSPDGWWLKTAADGLRAVPQQLQQYIVKQFEQLPESEQKLLKVASVCGESFSMAAVAVGLREDVENVDDRCMRLVHLGSLIRQGQTVHWPDGTASASFQFQHALYRQVIYERLGQVCRARLHHCLALRLEAAYGDRVGEIASQLALHFERGQAIPQAVRYYQLATKMAANRNALNEVLAHAQAGLGLLSTLPQTEQTIESALDLLILLGTSQIKRLGFASPEVKNTFSQAEKRCRRIDDRDRLGLVLMTLRSFYFVRGDMRTSSEYVQQLLALARQKQTSFQLAVSYLAAGNNHLYKGELADADTFLAKAIRHYTRQFHGDYITTFGVDVGVICHTHHARALRLLGYHDQAQHEFEIALGLARGLAHPFSLTQALSFALEHYHARGDLESMAPFIPELLGYCERYGFENIANQTWVFQGWLRAKQGEPDAGIRQLEQALRSVPSSGNKLREPYLIALQVDLYKDAGRYTEARAIVEQALAEVLDNALYIYQPELLRLRAELLLAESPEQSILAEHGLQESIEISHRQQARSMELRATVSLSRLRLAQGKPEQAYQAVQTLYDQFSEGFDTADLCNARALLDDCNARRSTAAEQSTVPGADRELMAAGLPQKGNPT